MKKLFAIITLLIVSVSAFSQSQSTSGRLLRKDTATYHPPASARQLIVDDNNAIAFWDGANWGMIDSDGTWTGVPVAGQYGGTGVANTGKTITLGGSLTTSGAYASTFTMSGATGVTFPTTGTLATLAGSEALTNKTLTNTGTFTNNGAFVMATGANKSINTVSLTSGIDTVTNTRVTANSIILVGLVTPSGTLGTHYAAPVKSAGVYFVIRSLNTSGAVVTTDNSDVWYMIIN